MKHVRSADGTTIAFRQQGSGPPLVLVHGGTADHSRWTRVAESLEHEFTVLSIDRRGRGESSDGPEYSVRREGEDIAAVLDSLGTPVDLVGHSFGAICSLEASLLARDLHRLVLYEPPVPVGLELIPPGVLERLQALVDGGEREEALILFFREVVLVPERELELMRTLPAWQRRVAAMHTLPRELRAAASYQFEPARFANMRTPVLLLLGGDSPPHVRKETETVHAALPNSRMVVMPGQQHIAMDTDLDLFLREIRSFLVSSVELDAAHHR